MNVGIITYHFVHNEGGVLQCYALQRSLEKMGYTPFVIDYRPSYHTVRYSAWKNPLVMARCNIRKYEQENIVRRYYYGMRGFLRAIKMNINRVDVLNDKLFSKFINNNLRMTKRYKHINELREDPPKMQVYISGSDQLWNPELTNYSFDEAYFLRFGSNTIKRITYAVSAKENFSQKEKEELSKLCSNLDYISTRETNMDIMDCITKSNTICLDPTLLLDKEDYIKIESSDQEDIPTENYVFVYGFQDSNDLNQVVEHVAKEYHLKVVNGSPTRIHLNIECKKIRDYAPDKFLAFIDHASFVVTNSFHGTVFSIIYRKKFISILHTTRGRRVKELLTKLNLEKNIYGMESFSWDVLIDYDTVYKRLAQLREQSFNYLNVSLNEI